MQFVGTHARSFAVADEPSSGKHTFYSIYTGTEPGDIPMNS